MKAPSPAFFWAYGAWMRRGSVRPRSYRGTRPRFASGTLMSLSDDTAPPRTLGYPRWHAVFSGCALRVSHGRSPQRSKEEAERPGDGCPCVGAEETCGVPPHTLHEMRGPTPSLHVFLNATSLPPGSAPDQYAKPSPPGTGRPTHQPAHQHPGPAE